MEEKQINQKESVAENATSTEKYKEEIEKSTKHLNFIDWFLIKFSFKRVSIAYFLIVILLAGIINGALISGLVFMKNNILDIYEKYFVTLSALLIKLNYILTLDFLFDNKFTEILTTPYIFNYLVQNHIFSDRLYHMYYFLANFISSSLHFIILNFIFYGIPALLSVRYRTTFPKHIIKYYEKFKRIDENLESSNIKIDKAKKLKEKKEKLWNEFLKDLKRRAKNHLKVIYFAKDIYYYFFNKKESIKANIIASFSNKFYKTHIDKLLLIENDKDLYNHLFENFYHSEDAKNLVKTLDYKLLANKTIDDIKKGTFFKESKENTKLVQKINMMKILLTLKVIRNMPLNRIYEYLKNKYNIDITKRERVVIKNVRKFFENNYIAKNPSKYIDAQYLILFPDFKDKPKLQNHYKAVKLYRAFLLEKLNYETKLNSLFNEYFERRDENNLKIAIETYEKFKRYFTNQLTQIVLIYFSSIGVVKNNKVESELKKVIEDSIYNKFFKEFEEKAIDKNNLETDNLSEKYSELNEDVFESFISLINMFDIKDFFEILNKVNEVFKEALVKLGMENNKMPDKIEPFYEKYYRIINFEQFLKEWK